MKNFDKEKFETELLGQCKGKQSCQASISYDAFQIPPENQTFGQYAFAQVACNANEHQ
jgi:hypothetical protein